MRMIDSGACKEGTPPDAMSTKTHVVFLDPKQAFFSFLFFFNRLHFYVRRINRASLSNDKYFPHPLETPSLPCIMNEVVLSLVFDSAFWSLLREKVSTANLTCSDLGTFLWSFMRKSELNAQI